MAITLDDFIVFCRRSFDRVLEVCEQLGDERINLRPTATGGTSPFGIVTHIVGACEWWVGHMVVGDASNRVRDDEFVASGTVGDLRIAVTDWLGLLERRRPAIAAARELVEPPRTQRPLRGEWTVGAALIHAYEELAQHLGHLEITADLLLAEHPVHHEGARSGSFDS